MSARKYERGNHHLLRGSMSVGQINRENITINSSASFPSYLRFYGNLSRTFSSPQRVNALHVMNGHVAMYSPFTLMNGFSREE